MSIKLLLLKSGEQVISDVKELIRKDKDDVYVDADELQLDLLGNDPILSTEYIMKSIY